MVLTLNAGGTNVVTVTDTANTGSVSFSGALGAWLGSLAGLSVGGSTMLAAMAASASYIAAPPAVRMTLPDANPTYYLTLALAITFPFNVLVGIPIYYKLALMAHGVA